MFIVGHTLVWHSQTPRWVFEDADGKPLSRDALLKRMREHIFAVMGRYKGRVHGWDVVNEALNEDGTMRQSAWFRIIGDDYVARAFEYAQEADPKAELYYNDYSLENPAKRHGAVQLVKRLKTQGLKVRRSERSIMTGCRVPPRKRWTPPFAPSRLWALRWPSPNWMWMFCLAPPGGRPRMWAQE